MDYQTVLSEVESWPVRERLRLLQEVWDRLPADDNLELSDELKAELDVRIDALDRNPEAAVPWDVIRDRLTARFQG